MAAYTFKVESVCSGGEHVTIGLYKDGAKVSTKRVERTDLNGLEVNVDDVALFLLRQAVIDHSANTPAKVKTAIENIVLTL